MAGAAARDAPPLALGRLLRARGLADRQRALCRSLVGAFRLGKLGRRRQPPHEPIALTQRRHVAFALGCFGAAASAARAEARISGSALHVSVAGLRM